MDGVKKRKVALGVKRFFSRTIMCECVCFEHNQSNLRAYVTVHNFFCAKWIGT